MHAAPHPHWRRNLFAISGASFIGFSGFTLAMPFLPLYIRQLGVSDVGQVAIWTGATLGVTPALAALMSPVWGRLADRTGRKIMVVRSLVSCVLVMTAMAFATAPWQLLALRAVLGVLTGYGGLTLTMAADSVPRDRMASAIGRVQTAQRLGPAMGPVMGGVLAGALGLRPSFLAAAGFYAAALVLVVALYDERETRHSRAATPAPATGLRALLAFENLALLLAIAFSTQFVDRSIGPVLALHVERMGVEAGRVALLAGLLFSLTAFSGAGGHHACGWLLRTYSARAVIARGAAASAAGAALFAVASEVWMLIPAAVLFGSGSGTVMTAVYTTAGRVFPRETHGAGFGLLTSASLVGVASGPVVSGLLGAGSLRAVFVLDAVVLAALSWIVTTRMTEGEDRT